MRYYAIRRKSDGAFLPAGRSRGFTHDRPTAPAACPPRLFVKERAAKAALKCWLKGDWREASGGHYMTGEPRWIGGEPPAQAPLDRISADMEVVSLYVDVTL